MLGELTGSLKCGELKLQPPIPKIPSTPPLKLYILRSEILCIRVTSLKKIIVFIFWLMKVRERQCSKH